MLVESIECDNLLAPVDDGSGNRIPESYNPILLLQKIKNPDDRRRFSLDVLSYYETFGYDTPRARLRIQETFQYYQK